MLALTGLAVLLLTSCSTSRRATAEHVKLNIESSESVEKADSVRVEQRDTLREITTITIQTNDRGDTLKVTQVTDRERIRSKSDVSSKKDVVRTERDTVYIAVRDSVSSSKFKVSGDSLNPQPSALNPHPYIEMDFCSDMRG